METLISIGMKVCFDSKVFESPYTPYYDDYKGHQFEVINIHEGNHVELKCIDNPDVIVKGCVHDDELIQM